ncbi:MAG: oligosaccharide flippase family protein [Flavobacteriaceae bacterium]
MNIKLPFFTGSSFQKNIFSMFKGTVVAQVIGVVGSLFLAKIYAPNLYGFYSAFLSFTSIITILSSLKLEYIIITDKSDTKSINVANSLLVVSLVTSVVPFIFFTLFRGFFLDKGITFTILLLSVLTALITANSRILESYATRKSKFKRIANAKILTTFSTISIQLILFYFIKDGLIYGFIGSTIIVLLFYLITSRKFIKKPNFQLFKESIKTHINLLKFGFPSGLLNATAINSMPILMLSFFTASTAGVYALSLKIVSLPLFIISASLSQVYFQKASEYYNHQRGELYSFTKKVVKSNILIIIGFLLLLNTVGVYLLNFVYDNEWENLSLYIFMLSFYILQQTSFSPISSIIVITNKMQIGLLFNISLFLINLIAIYIGYLYDSIFITVLILSIFGGLGYVILLAYFLKLIKSYKNES